MYDLIYVVWLNKKQGTKRYDNTGLLLFFLKLFEFLLTPKYLHFDHQFSISISKVIKPAFLFLLARSRMTLIWEILGENLDLSPEKVILEAKATVVHD